MKKLLYYIIITCWIFILSWISIFAATSIDFSTQKTDYHIDDTIQVEISIQSDERIGSDVSINWIDNFQVVWKRQSQRTSIINWSQTSIFDLQLTLLAEEAWTFSLWPVTVQWSSGTISSKVLELTITGERIMVNNSLNTFKKNTWQLAPTPANDDEEENNIDNIVLDSSSGSLTPKEILWVDGEVMKDIYPEKWYLYWSLISKNSLIFLFFAFLALAFYKVLEHYLQIYNSKKITGPQPINTVVKKEVVNYSQLISDLEKNHIESKKDLFYSEATKIFRKFLWDKFWNVAASTSFTQLQRTIPEEKEILKSYAQIYFPEYSKIPDSIEERKKIISDLKSTLL